MFKHSFRQVLAIFQDPKIPESQKQIKHQKIIPAKNPNSKGKGIWGGILVPIF